MVNDKRLKVAVFGGSFDPPHYGHQQIVTEALKHLDIDKLIVLPAYLNPFKSGSLADASTRLAWCHTLFDTIPKVLVSDYEIKQQKSVKTAQSVKHFKAQYDVKYLIIGADNLSTLTQWHDFAWLNETITWVIITRPGYTLDTTMLRDWKVIALDAEISSSQIRQLQQTDAIDTQIADSVKNILKGQQLHDNGRKN